MGEEKGKIQALREWVVEHKLRTVGTLWASGILGSMAYNWSQPNMKTRACMNHEELCLMRFLCTRCDLEKYVDAFVLHAQALTLAALSGAAIVEYYDHKSGAKTERVAKFLDLKENQHKN
ncbi:hypothetical protein AAHA92_16691 [Salvia divinorum]|uniref:HIG1 domain-containing protein n=1 Tax=Salvia divinorum TaxID=28513 RepID=A0ABD1GWD0_SALDI